MTPQDTSFPNPSAGSENRFSAVCRVLDEAIAAHAFPGCAFGVLAGGEVVLCGARGRFTYDESSRAVTQETVYDVASLTKVAATTFAAMLLHQRGRLDLATPLGELLPGFTEKRAASAISLSACGTGGTVDPTAGGAAGAVGRTAGAAGGRVTLGHLLAHNSGLPGYVEFFRAAATPEAVLNACLELPLEAAPGTRAEYSDPGFILLGKALEALTGEPLAIWVQREIFLPLSLKATGFCPAPGTWGSIPPTEEDITLRHRRIQGEVQDENAWLLGGVAGHAGVFSCVGDLLRIAGEILAAVAGRAEARLFNASTVELFSQRQAPPDSSRALGWDTPSENSSAGRYFSPHSIGHLGFSGCSLWIDLEAGIAAALLTNRTWPDRRSQLIRTVRPQFHDAVRQALSTAPRVAPPGEASSAENSDRV
jgi:CubicO group peptidase (beta-lactamase class C family)